jgi:ribosomal protein S12 methylthiotransferase accessory factor YcaO
MPVEQSGGVVPDQLGGSFVPMLATGCRAHHIADDRVLILGPGLRVLLRGRAHTRVIALIDGRSCIAEIVSALAGELPPALVHLSLVRLAERRLTVASPPGAVSPATVASRPCGAGLDEAALVRTVLPDPGELRFVGVGVTEATVAALAARVAAGFSRPTASPAGLLVAVVDDYLRPALDRLADRCRADGCGLLPIRAAGPEWWLGPYCDGANAGPMWSLFSRRLRANRRDDLHSLGLGATFPLYGELEPPELVPDAVAAAAETIEATLRGEPPASVVGALSVLDVRRGTWTTHPIAVIAEPAAGATPAFGQALPALTVTRVRSLGSPEGALAQMARLISPITGIVAGLERLPAVPGTHVYAASGTLDWLDDGRPIFRRGAMGKGLTDVQARLSCMGEAIELVSASFTGDEWRRRAHWREVREIAVHPQELLLISDAQRAHAAREPATAGWDGVPAALDERHAIEWVPLRSLISGRTRWLPAAYCYLDYADPRYPGAPYAIANANGCAAGETLDDAILQGLLELIERDASALWWYSRARRPGVDLDAVGDPRLDVIRDGYAALGRGLAVLDLSTDIGVPVVAAVAWDLSDGTALSTGRGCHLDPRTAILRAVTELSQVSAVGSPGDPRPHGATAAERPYLFPDRSTSVLAAQLTPTGGDATARLVGTLARLGHDVLVLDTTRADLGIPSVRVVVPGLRPLLPRLAPGRLYDVPAALGWVPRKLREDELNPEAFAS